MQRSHATTALLLAALALAGCKRGDMRGAADSTASRADTAMNRTAAATDTAARRIDTSGGNVAQPESGGWTNPSIIGFALAANEAEVRESRLAERKATDPAVKAFARQMLADHEKMLSDVRSLERKLHVTPDTARGDAHDLLKDANDEMKDLTSKPAGKDWDKDFINKEIDGHQKVLEKLQDAAKNAQNPELRTALEKATGKVQEHLTRAQELKNRLNA